MLLVSAHTKKEEYHQSF